MSVETVSAMITWLGHDTVRIDAASTVYIDPYDIEGGKTADIILITHEHYDHCSPEDVARIQDENTVIVTEKDSAKKLKGDVRIVAPGDTITVKGMTVRAVPAYNTDKTFHPKARGWLGFIIEVDGIAVYHAGDTDVIPEMASFKPDIALLPVSGTYVMTADEAVEAAKRLTPSLAIPMHYGSIVGSDNDAAVFRNALEGIIQVKVLEKGR